MSEDHAGQVGCCPASRLNRPNPPPRVRRNALNYRDPEDQHFIDNHLNELAEARRAKRGGAADAEGGSRGTLSDKTPEGDSCKETGVQRGIAPNKNQAAVRKSTRGATVRKNVAN